MSKISPKIQYIFVGLLACGGAFLLTYKARSQALDYSYTPFVAQTVVEHYAKPMASPVVQYSTYARKSDGSEATITTVHDPDGKLIQLTAILDVPGQKQVQLEPITKSVSTYYLSMSQVRNLLPSNGCAGTAGQAAGKRSEILGFRVVSSHEERPFRHSDHETVDERLAPELNCFALQRSETLASGPHNEATVIAVIKGEPPESMFAIPSDYIERSPSRVSAEWSLKFPGAGLFKDSTAKLLDKGYYLHQQAH